MDSLGDTLRNLREKNQLPLRTVAAFLDIDQAILSKIERGQRRASRDLVVKLAGYFKVPEKDLVVAWLSDKLVYELVDEEAALEALKMAEEKVASKSFSKTDRKEIIKKIKDYLAHDQRVSKAWIFGSFARGDDDHKSDIDMMIKVPDGLRFSLFDLADIQYQLELITKRKIDLVEEGNIQPFAWETAKHDLISIYG